MKILEVFYSYDETNFNRIIKQALKDAGLDRKDVYTVICKPGLGRPKVFDMSKHKPKFKKDRQFYYSK